MHASGPSQKNKPNQTSKQTELSLLLINSRKSGLVYFKVFCESLCFAILELIKWLPLPHVDFREVNRFASSAGLFSHLSCLSAGSRQCPSVLCRIHSLSLLRFVSLIDTSSAFCQASLWMGSETDQFRQKGLPMPSEV